MESLGTLRVLPFELLTSITSYLKPAEVWYLRSVSKGFKALLSHDTVVLQALKKHVSGASMANLAEQTKIFKSHFSGIPQSVLNLNFANVASWATPVLEGKRLAYQVTAGKARVVNLETGASRTTGRGDAGKLVLTSEFLAFCSRGACFAYDLKHLNERLIKASSDDMRIVALAGHSSRLGMISASSEEEEDDYYDEPEEVNEELSIYDMATGTCIFKLSLGPRNEIVEHLEPKLAMNARTCLIVSVPVVDRYEAMTFFQPDDDEFWDMPGRTSIPFAEITQVDIATGSKKSYDLKTRCTHNEDAFAVSVRPAGLNDWLIGVEYAKPNCNYHHGMLRLGRTHQWHEMDVRGKSAAFWKGTTWTVSGYPFDEEPYWSYITAERNTYYPRGIKKRDVNRIMQYHPTSVFTEPMELLVSEHFLVAYIAKRGFTVYAFGDSSLPKTNLGRVDLSVSFLDMPGLVHCWTPPGNAVKSTALQKQLRDDPEKVLESGNRDHPYPAQVRKDADEARKKALLNES